MRPRFVIDSGTGLHLAVKSIDVSPKVELYAPTLWRSEVLSEMYSLVSTGELAEDAARERLRYVNALKIRLLGDAVLRRRAWEVAQELGLDSTYPAEYVALASLQKCTLVSMDKRWLERAGAIVPTATVDALTADP